MRIRRRSALLPRRAVLMALLVGLAATGGAAAQTTTVPQWPEARGQGVCYSQLGWCPLLRNAERIPVGVACYCMLPDGRYVAGTTSNLYYHGRVSLYFNLHPPPVPTMIK